MAFPATKLQPLAFSSLLVTLIHLFLFPEGTATSGASARGFTTYLIPRDSPLSPFYNASNTHLGRMHDAFQRSLERANRFRSALIDPKGSKFQARALPSSDGEFFMNITIGTPPVVLQAIADTGSVITWTQVKGCQPCFPQTLPLYDPQSSLSWNPLSCKSGLCPEEQEAAAVAGAYCFEYDETCYYKTEYGDGSYSMGRLATEELTIGIDNPITFPFIVFGCGDNNGGDFSNGSGVIGLGRGNLSLIYQLRQFVDGKFSYCLVPSFTDTSNISFGIDAVVSGPGAITTPLVTKSPPRDVFYAVTLEGFSVGDNKTVIPFPGDEGNIFIDSGTPLTILPPQVYGDLVSALDLEMDYALDAVKTDPVGVLKDCYKIDNDPVSFPISKLPSITAHFKGGDVILQPLNIFHLEGFDVVCLAMLNSSDIDDDDVAIFGNLAQKNFIVGFDLEAGNLTFIPRDCTQP